MRGIHCCAPRHGQLLQHIPYLIAIIISDDDDDEDEIHANLVVNRAVKRERKPEEIPQAIKREIFFSPLFSERPTVLG